MRISKSLITVLLLSFGLTGCYTQLEYTQKMSRITDEKPVEGYAWSEDSQEQEDGANLTVADSIYIAETYGAKVDPYREGEGEYGEYADDEYIPIEYKDYSVVEQYDACGCNPYETYVIYNNNYYPSSWSYNSGFYYSSYRYHWRPYNRYYGPFYSWHWKYRGFHYDHFSFGFALNWGVPYYYYDPFFYDPFYYGFYGYYRPFYYNNYYFGSYAGNFRHDRTDRRYGRRSIGADRVRSGDRSRNSGTLRTRTGINRGDATSTIRTRSKGVQRSRGTIQNTRSNTTRSRGTTRVGNSSRSRTDTGTKSRGTVTRSRSGDGGGSGTRSRSRSKVDRDRKDGQASVLERNLRSSRKAIILPPANRTQMERRISQQRAKKLENARRSSSRKSFFGRLNGIFDQGNRSIKSTRRSGSSRSFKIPSRSRTKSSIGRSRSSGSSSRSTVTRSRSSSKSSPSRSRGSSSNKRSRDNN